MGFKASEAVEALDYDFRPYTTAHGTSPEPSSEQVRKFRDRFVGLSKKMNREIVSNADSTKTDSEILDFVANMSTDEIRSIEVEINEAVSELLSGQPSLEDLNALSAASYRHHQAYIGSVMGDIFDPESSDAVLSRSRVAKNGVKPTTRFAKS